MIVDVEIDKTEFSENTCFIINDYDDDGEREGSNTSIQGLVISINRMIEVLNLLDPCKVYYRPWEEEI